MTNPHENTMFVIWIYSSSHIDCVFHILGEVGAKLKCPFKTRYLGVAPL